MPVNIYSANFKHTKLNVEVSRNNRLILKANQNFKIFTIANFKIKPI